MASLIRMRLYAFVRSGRVAAPAVTSIIVIGTLYGGGAVQAGEGYGLSAYVLVPVLGWQTKLVLDTEPEVARKLATVIVGRRREIVAGVIAAAVVALCTVVLALALPWLFGGITGKHAPGDPTLADGIVLGAWAHLLALGPALAIGTLSSRVVTRSAGYGALALVAGWLTLVVVGLPRSPVRWIGPPMLAVSHEAHRAIRTASVVGLSVWTLAWTGVALAAYAAMRRVRA